ncbi:MAG: hypothetical protein ACRCZF_21720 [Gemmataceae bacterium]
MTGTTLLLRQIHPSFVQHGFATSQAFRPTPKDQSMLSVYDGDQITPEDSFLHYTTVWKLESVGTMAVTVDDCLAENLTAVPDPLEDCPQHALIHFIGLTPGQCEKKSKKLKAKAEQRGWLHQAKSSR